MNILLLALTVLIVWFLLGAGVAATFSAVRTIEKSSQRHPFGRW